MNAEPASAYTGPGSRQQGPVDAEQQGTGPEIYSLVLDDVIGRAEFGARKYGHPLRTTAGIDFLTNLYQELLDGLIYARGELELRGQLGILLHQAYAVISDAPQTDATRYWLSQFRRYAHQLPAQHPLDSQADVG